jgi:hypothetical protein
MSMLAMPKIKLSSRASWNHARMADPPIARNARNSRACCARTAGLRTKIDAFAQRTEPAPRSLCSIRFLFRNLLTRKRRKAPTP